MSILLSCACSIAIAAEGQAADSMQTRAAAMMVRSGLKAMLMRQDFQSFKKNKRSELEKLDEVAFREEYARCWEVFRKCPRLVAKYRLRSDFSKKEALATIDRLTRGDCLEAIDQMPDDVILDLIGGGSAGGDGRDERMLFKKIAAFMQGGAAPEAMKK